jgi:hypothetical protein
MASYVPIPLLSHWMSTLLLNFIYQFQILIWCYKRFKGVLRILTGSCEIQRIIRMAQEDMVPTSEPIAELRLNRFYLMESQLAAEGLAAVHRIPANQRAALLYRLGNWITLIKKIVLYYFLINYQENEEIWNLKKSN